MVMRILSGLLLCMPIWAQTFPISPADTDERRIIEERFNSTEPADLAWAAHLAANYKQPSYVPRIIELLQHSDRDIRLEIGRAHV